MNDLLEAKASGLELDSEGSLLDADMSAYYVWLDQQRLSGSARSSFITWFEGHTRRSPSAQVSPAELIPARLWTCGGSCDG